MSNTVQKADVLTKEQSVHVDRFRLYRSTEKMGFEQALTSYYLSGLELVALQDSATHAKVDADNSFKALCQKHLPEISQSDAYRRIAFAKKVKIPTVGILGDKLLLADGQVPRKVVESVIDEVGKHTDGKTVSAVLRDLEIIREKKPAQHHPRKIITPEEQVAAEERGRQELANQVLRNIHTLFLDERSIAELKPLTKQELLAAFVKGAELCRKYLAKKNSK